MASKQFILSVRSDRDKQVSCFDGFHVVGELGDLVHMPWPPSDHDQGDELCVTCDLVEINSVPTYIDVPLWLCLACSVQHSKHAAGRDASTGPSHQSNRVASVRTTSA